MKNERMKLQVRQQRGENAGKVYTIVVWRADLDGIDLDAFLLQRGYILICLVSE